MLPYREPRGYWGVFLALGLGLASSGHAQEQAQSADERPADQPAPAGAIPLPVPVEIIEDDASARAREGREAENRQRDLRDLAAQEGMNEAAQAMNEATQRMADLSLWQTRLAVVGTAALVATLILMWNANRITRQVGKNQLRAYLVLESMAQWVGGTQDIPIEAVNLVIRISNQGQTPAKFVKANAALQHLDGVGPGYDPTHAAEHKDIEAYQFAPGLPVSVIIGQVPIARVQSLIASEVKLLLI